MRCAGWCGECYAFVKGRGPPCGRRRRRWSINRVFGRNAVTIRRPKVKAPAEGALVVLEGAELSLYPTVWEFISAKVWADGATRVTGSVTLFTEDGFFKGCVNDKDGNLVAFVSSASVGGLFEAMERGLSADTLEWRKGRSIKGMTGKGRT
jgi:hypothetical protein